MGTFGNNFGNNWAYPIPTGAAGGFPQSRQAPQPRYRTIQIAKYIIPIKCRIIRPKISIPVKIKAEIQSIFLKKNQIKLKKLGKILGIIDELKKLDD